MVYILSLFFSLDIKGSFIAWDVAINEVCKVEETMLAERLNPDSNAAKHLLIMYFSHD